MTGQRLNCKCCGKPMQRAGSGFSGKREVAMFRCGNRKCKDFGSRHMDSKQGYIRKEK